ncbi:uncharacterized protein M421DRAFT_1109 [Didymella exigua CBS 183.55]|uniref:Uncharacterized protein n=1 Tax=Didymella exigua CBS 183.55 TaxID=1150837 RepID=A0A6A5S2S8_9PLEO|nr:uncharacterized protein M421DRAFT_1109 [Didymella exigua CBS 183.55]KAF1933734.1 hypothetical protein M421DRAFT_1109 [Didymella exigua CBS 183.55]
MDIYFTEQKTLLPLVELAPQPMPPRRSFTSHQRELIESCALALILILAASQCLILHEIHSLPYAIPSSTLCIFLTNLAAGLRLSIPAGLPTATLLFIASPYVSRSELIPTMWYLILLCYLVGSTLGALLLVWVAEV